MNLDLQLSDLRRAFDVATTKIDGQLAIILQKVDYAEQRARENAEHTATEFAARDQQIAKLVLDYNQLRTKIYFLSGFATALGGAIGVITAVVTKS